MGKQAAGPLLQLTMYIALRRGPASSATYLQRLTSDYIRFRLATIWPHAGVVIAGQLYHVSGHGGMQVSDYDPAKWDLIDVGGDDAAAVALFHQIKSSGGGYDYVELLGFTGARSLLRLVRRIPWVRKKLDINTYCYQLALWLVTLRRPTFRVTPELLLWHAHITKCNTTTLP